MIEKGKCKHCMATISKRIDQLIWRDTNHMDFLAIMCMTSPTKQHQPEEQKDEEKEDDDGS